MNHGLWLRNTGGTSADDLVELGVEAEAAGWDGVFVSDSLPYESYPDPWVLLAGLASRTDDVRLGTWVVPVPRREPWQIAQEVATLDRLSGGRVVLGVGLGNADDYDAYGTPYDPPVLGERFDEALEVVAELWSGDPIDHDGEHFTLEGAEVQPTPVQEPRVPILAGCWWPNKKPLHRGARWDGIMPFWVSLTADEAGPHGEEATGSPEEELRAVVEYYRSITDDPGDIVVPTVPTDDPAAYVETCESLGVTWVLATDVDPATDEGRARVEAGPPG